jgi:hypothetical protein
MEVLYRIKILVKKLALKIDLFEILANICGNFRREISASYTAKFRVDY